MGFVRIIVMRFSARVLVILMFVLVSFPYNVNAQSKVHNHENEHVHAANEIGVGNFLSFQVGEQEFAYGLHIHYLRAIENSRFGFGFGYEQIFDEHKHRTLGLIGTYRLSLPIILSLSPGILLPNQGNQDFRFALHSELVYEFEIDRFHLGPTLEFATTFEEYHIGIGLHFAYTF